MKVLSLDNAKIIAEDGPACEFLLAEGALSGLVPDPPHDTITAFWRSADTHNYCHASYSRVAGDTGYVVVLFPFEHYTEEEAAQMSTLLTLANTDRPDLTIGYVADMENPQN